MFRERVWGRKDLTPFFPHSLAERDIRLIGEVWYTSEENFTSLGISFRKLLTEDPRMLGLAADPNHPGICPLLIKLIFTTERLSVQVHPDDAYAESHYGSQGKTEAWYVVTADPSAEVALGFREALTPERVRDAVQSGDIEHLLAWRKVKPGDVVFVPAGTVHAIGAGLTIFEVQENSDITYRLYDYGRPRELHIEHGMAVANLEPYSYQPSARSIANGREELMYCKYFRMERLRAQRSITLQAELPYYLLLICLQGEGTIAGFEFAPGQAWFIPAGGEEFSIEGTGLEWMLTYAAQEHLGEVQVD